MSNELDTIIARLQNMQPFNIWEVKEDGTVAPWYTVTGTLVIPDLVIKEADLQEQVQTVTAQIAHWGRLAAQCKRVWQIQDRNYRIWRDQLKLALHNPPEGEKKPTQAVIDMRYRTDPEYAVWYEKIERAEEAYNAALAILDGWRAKERALKFAVYRSNEDGKARLSI